MDILNIYWVNSRDHITHFHDRKCIRDLQQPQKFSSLEFRKTNRCGSSNRPSRPTTSWVRGRHLRASILWRGRTTWSGTDRMDRLTTTWCTTATTSGPSFNSRNPVRDLLSCIGIGPNSEVQISPPRRHETSSAFSATSTPTSEIKDLFESDTMKSYQHQ